MPDFVRTTGKPTLFPSVKPQSRAARGLGATSGISLSRGML